MISTSYRVSIAFANNGGATNSDGFIDVKTIEQYMADASPSAPSTYVQSQSKERANIRFDFVQQQIQLEANVYIKNASTTGATATAAGTAFVFTAVVERGDGVLWTRDEATPGAVLTGQAALKRWIARALIGQRTCYGDIYDPTALPTPGNSTASDRFGTRTVQITVGPLAANLTAAEALVTITAL